MRGASGLYYARNVAQWYHVMQHGGHDTHDTAQLTIEHVEVEQLTDDDYAEKLDD